MAQFTVYRNRSPRTRGDVPYLLAVQSDLLQDLATRVVVPLYRKTPEAGPAITRLMPELVVEGVSLIMNTAQLAGVAVRELGEPVTVLADHRQDILAALDLLFTGF